MGATKSAKADNDHWQTNGCVGGRDAIGSSHRVAFLSTVYCSSYSFDRPARVTGGDPRVKHSPLLRLLRLQSWFSGSFYYNKAADTFAVPHIALVAER